MKRRGTIVISVTVFVVLAAGKWWLQSEPELEGISAQEIQQEEKLSRLERFKSLFSQAAEETKGRFAKAFTKMGVRYLRERANETNQYRGTAGYVRERFAPSWNEQNFRRKRLEGVIRAQNNYFSTRLTQEGALKVGLVFSGGGYRAMILTTGYMQALSDLGLVDASMYISTLSGSTWFLALVATFSLLSTKALIPA